MQQCKIHNLLITFQQSVDPRVMGRQVWESLKLSDASVDEILKKRADETFSKYSAANT